MKWYRALLPALIGLGLAGCGSSEAKTVSVKGKLTKKDGSPFHVQRPDNSPLPPGDPGIRIKFSRADGGEGDNSFYAAINPTEATFEVPGNSRKGIPPGKYTVTVFLGVAGGEKDAQGRPQNRPPGGPPGPVAPSSDGKEVTRQEVTVPDEGLADLAIVIDQKP